MEWLASTFFIYCFWQRETKQHIIDSAAFYLSGEGLPCLIYIIIGQWLARESERSASEAGMDMFLEVEA